MKQLISFFLITLFSASALQAQSLTGGSNGSSSGTSGTAPKKWNVVFFLVDDLGWSDVGYQGSSFYNTPNIDSFSKEGVRFSQAYAACHVCSPTRASILTGQY